MDVTEQDEPTRVVAQVRRVVPTAELTSFYDTAYRDVVGAVDAAGGVVSGAAVGWYHGMPADTVDVAAGFEVEGLPLGPLSGEVEVVEIPGGPAFSGEHRGAYDGLPAAWGEVEAARAASGRAPRGDFWEEYVTEPSPGGDPAANRTRLVLPLA